MQNYKKYLLELFDTKTKTFTNDLGYVKYSNVNKEDRYEYVEENDLFWEKSNVWIQVLMFEVRDQQKGNGKILMKDWLNIIPNGTGIVLNANPQNNILSFEKIQNWYISLGFQPISKNNISLYMIR